MTQQEVKNKIKNALMSSPEIFDCPPQCLHMCDISESSDDNKKYLTFCFPRRIGLDQVDGFKLINEKGYISIQEKYIKKQNGTKLERVSYIYKYITKEVNYMCTHYDSGKISETPYKFHYDMDLEYENSKKHPLSHLQVLHNHPRFEMGKEITPLEFLEKVRVTCFQNITGTPIPYTEPIFLLK